VFPPTPLGDDAKWQRLYDWFAPVYDLNERFFGRVVANLRIAEERARIVSILGLQQGMSILEVSPGPGVYQRDIRAAVGADAYYAAADLSMGMLNQCQKRNRRLNVALLQANGSHLPFVDDSFDALFHFGGVNLFDQPEAAISEFIRVVKKGGIVSWGDEHFSASIPDGWKKRFLARMNPGYLREPPSIPSRLSNLKQVEVFGGYGYLIIANK
jgi:ubiquinone/menaquinone biosynthesis C-methylase UbiE